MENIIAARELALKQTSYFNVGFSEGKAVFRRKLARLWGHNFARAWFALLLGLPQR